MIRVLIWNEYYHEQNSESVRAVYPKGIHGAIADFLKNDPELVVETATLYDENCGITKERLDQTDVIVWWGHMRHHLVPDEVTKMVCDAVLEGMGAIFLHSAHHSKPFRSLMGTPCHLCWKMAKARELIWAVDPSHPIARGIDRFISLETEETYGEPFRIPDPDELVFLSNFSSGEVLRSGCVFRRGNGRIFYFQPGHETYPIYHQPPIQTVIRNAVHYVASPYREALIGPNVRSVDDPLGYVIEKK